MPQQMTNTFKIEADGSPLPDDIARLVANAAVDANLDLPDMFVVTFRDPDRIVLTKTAIKIGSKITISVVSEAMPAGEKLLSGEVTALEASYDPGGTLTVVRGFDQSHRLFHGRATEVYKDVTASDIAAKVAQRAGLEAGAIDPTTTVFKHIAQANVSDWQFLRSLASEIDYKVAVAEGKLDFRAPPDASGAPAEGDIATENPFQLTLGKNLLRFRTLVTSAEQVGQVQARGWDPMQKKALVGTTPAATKGAKLAVGPADLASTFGNPTFVATDRPFSRQEEVDAAAKAVAEQIAGAFAEFDGVAVGNPKLKAGVAVTLGLVGDPFDGSYTLTATRHVYDPGDGYTTWFTVSGRQERSLLSLASGGVAGGGSGPGIAGVTSAIVTDVRDPEGLCRVKLSFPWLSDNYESDWARTVQPGAAKDRGAVLLPEVNDEVLVAFEQGDVQRPYVIGGLYNGTDRPKPAALTGLVDPMTGSVQSRILISRKGHHIILNDGDGSDGVTIRTGSKRLRIRLNEAESSVAVGADRLVEIKSNGSVVIKGADVQVEGTGAVTVKAGAALKLQAAAGISIDGGGGVVEVKGSTIKLN